MRPVSCTQVHKHFSLVYLPAARRYAQAASSLGAVATGGASQLSTPTANSTAAAVARLFAAEVVAVAASSPAATSSSSGSRFDDELTQTYFAASATLFEVLTDSFAAGTTANMSSALASTSPLAASNSSAHNTSTDVGASTNATSTSAASDLETLFTALAAAHGTSLAPGTAPTALQAPAVSLMVGAQYADDIVAGAALAADAAASGFSFGLAGGNRAEDVFGGAFSLAAAGSAAVCVDTRRRCARSLQKRSTLGEQAKRRDHHRACGLASLPRPPSLAPSPLPLPPRTRNCSPPSPMGEI